MNEDSGWETLREGIQIKHLSKDPKSGLQMDIIKVRSNFTDSAHIHDGFEWVYVLEGSFYDKRGHHKKGDFTKNVKGERHQISTKSGCKMIVIWSGSVTPAEM
jgi:anti-sigma factor ChrR (cupin superfamily)